MAVGWKADPLWYEVEEEDDFDVLDDTSDGISSSASEASSTTRKWISEASRSHRQDYYHQPSRYSPQQYKQYNSHHHRLLKQAQKVDSPTDLIKMVLVSAALEKKAKVSLTLFCILVLARICIFMNNRQIRFLLIVGNTM